MFLPLFHDLMNCLYVLICIFTEKIASFAAGSSKVHAAVCIVDTVWHARVLGDVTLVDLLQVTIIVKTYGTDRFVRLEFPYKTV